ncbi:MAG TPA: ATP-binding cassette domain-containing protein [Streptosporangiaceae bacterium]|jgi:ABC-type thiamine transport system ATPase subunit|nr:ATP-binding cassette domain-containing protein [Streptosporangiaceae bacterium]
MRALPPAVHRTIVAVDVEKFGDRRRTNPHRLAVRDGLYRALGEAFAKVGVPWEDTYHEDRGDGAFALIRADVPKSHVAARLSGPLAAALRRHNESHPPEARIRLRVALHAGEVHHDGHGVAGAALDLTFRLLDSPDLKSALAAGPGEVALIASNWFFDDVIRHTPECAPATYRQVTVAVKETKTTAWVSLPEPGPAPADASAAGGGTAGAKRFLGWLDDLFGGGRPAAARAARAATHDGKTLRLHGLRWEAGARYAIDPDPLVVERRAVVVVIAEPVPAAALADVIVGLARPVAGSVSLDRTDVTRRGPTGRRIALIPLGGGLLPHLSVAGNIAYAQGRAAATRVSDIARRLGLSEVLHWHPHELSPVQRLRVAVARALCAQPEPVAVVIEDRDGHPACRAAVATAREQDLAVLVITDSRDRGYELSGRLHTARRDGADTGRRADHRDQGDRDDDPPDGQRDRDAGEHQNGRDDQGGRGGKDGSGTSGGLGTIGRKGR